MGTLVKIRDMSSKYDVSARTLRYYEDMGLIESTRTDDYAYRLYDEAAVKKLEQILILRKLNISIKDIQRIFKSSGSDVVLEVLGKKVDDIDDEVALLHELKQIVLEFIRQIEQSDFSNDSDVKKLYEKAKDIENQIASAEAPSPVSRLMEVATRLEERTLPNVMIVNMPPFRAVTFGQLHHHHEFGAFWQWGEENRHLRKELIWGNSEFVFDKAIEGYTGEFTFSIRDDVTAADVAPYKIIEVPGGLYATAVCVDMDDESISSIHPRIIKWLEGTNFVHDTDRDFIGHMLCPLDEVKRGLGYHQLQRYVPIKFNTDNWQTVYSLTTDEFVLAQENGAKNGGFSSRGLTSTGNPEYTFLDGTILVEKRQNDWDGVNVKLDEMDLSAGHYCSIEVVGRVTGMGKNKKAKGSIELTRLPGYDNMAFHAIVDGENFKLAHIFPVMKDSAVPVARISSHNSAKTVPFLIESIEVAVKPFTQEPNYTAEVRLQQDIADLAGLELFCVKKQIAGIDGVFLQEVGGEGNAQAQQVEQAKRVKIAGGKYFKVAMLPSYDSVEDFCKDVFENHLPHWLFGGAGHEVVNKPYLLMNDPQSDSGCVLYVNVRQLEDIEVAEL